MPVEAPAAAIAGAAELQVPPVVASLSVVVAPAATFSVPEMAAGDAFTVTVFVVYAHVPNV